MSDIPSPVRPTRGPFMFPTSPLPFRRTWLFENADYKPDFLDEIGREWPHIQDEHIKELIAADEQFLRYHRFLLRELRSHGHSDKYPKSELSLSLRAGMVRTEIFFLGGIAEAALRAHAVISEIVKPNDKAMFGKLLDLWCRHGLSHVDPILPELNELRESRNTIHLHVARKQAQEGGNRFWKMIEARETEISQLGNKVLGYLKAFRNPGALRNGAGPP